MIPTAYVTEWRAEAPWATDAQVEQDLILSRAICELYSDARVGRELAFRGGTALNKLHLRPASRYSEDIDLVQVTAEPIGETSKAVRSKLDPLLGEPEFKQGQGRFTLYYRVKSEIPPVTPLKVKVEINTREHFFALGRSTVPFSVESRWFRGSVSVLTYAIEELLGTKLRALYQRKKGRDLFDLSQALTRLPNIEIEKVIRAFREYMKHSSAKVSRKQFERNVSAKLNDAAFVNDVPPLLVSGAAFNVQLAYEHVREQLLARL